jgi:hypothetical protein
MTFSWFKPQASRIQQALGLKRGLATLLLTLQITYVGGASAAKFAVEEAVDQLSGAVAVQYGISTTQFINCSPLNILQIRQAELRGIQLVNDWKQLLEKRYGNVSPYERAACNLATHQEVLAYQARQVLGCIQREMLKGLTYVCGLDLSKKRDLASTLPLIGKKVKLDKRLLAGTIPGDLTGVLLHEASHKCGTNDLTYFSLIDRPHSVIFSEWPSIADTYHYWARYGFCIPGVDCNSK